jgi:hypothetical protein
MRFSSLQLGGSCAGLTWPVATAKARAASMSVFSCMHATVLLDPARLQCITAEPASVYYVLFMKQAMHAVNIGRATALHQGRPADQ